MCKDKGHKHHSRISDIHSCLKREFFFTRNQNAIKVEDDENVLRRRAELENNPQDYNALIALGDALAYQMRYNEALQFYERAREINFCVYLAHRKCAVRYLSLLDTARAKSELEWCAQYTDNKLDIRYLQAVTAYCDGEYARAIQYLNECYDFARDIGEMYVAVLFWHILCLVAQNQNVDEALRFYYNSLDGGHHIGYMQAVKLFRFDDVNADKIIEKDDELNMSIYLFGLYAYYKYKGDSLKAVQTLDNMLAFDTYFSSFVYLGAYSERQRNLISSENKLENLLKQKLAIAFSGGTDSAFLLCAAKRAGADVKAYFVKSAFQPNFEVEDAKRLAEELNIPCEFIDVDVLCDNDIIDNGKDRCYYCKRKIFGKVIEHAKRDGYNLIADGTNASDNLNERPGARAMKELGVISPLRECGLTKADVRFLSRKYGVFTWDKPSYSCLATRVQTGEQITNEVLKKIESAESLMFNRGYKNFRVRVKNNCAKIEIAGAQNEDFQREKDDIVQSLLQYFDSVEQSEILR